MQPTNVILDRMANLLAADATTLAPASDALHVHLIKEAFTPGVDTDFTTLDEATFTGSTAKAAGVGACQEFDIPETAFRVIQLNEPAGGWHWETSDAVNLPQTIYGYVVTDNDDLITYGSALLDAPVVLTGTNQGLDIGNVRFTINPALIS